jgi:hypothetical protein
MAVSFRCIKNGLYIRVKRTMTRNVRKKWQKSANGAATKPPALSAPYLNGSRLVRVKVIKDLFKMLLLGVTQRIKPVWRAKVSNDTEQ